MTASLHSFFAPLVAALCWSVCCLLFVAASEAVDPSKGPPPHRARSTGVWRETRDG